MDILKFTEDLKQLPRKINKVKTLESDLEKSKEDLDKMSKRLIKIYNTATDEQKAAIEAFKLNIGVNFDSTADFMQYLDKGEKEDVAE